MSILARPAPSMKPAQVNDRSSSRHCCGLWIWGPIDLYRLMRYGKCPDGGRIQILVGQQGPRWSVDDVSVCATLIPTIRSNNTSKLHSVIYMMIQCNNNEVPGSLQRTVIFQERRVVAGN